MILDQKLEKALNEQVNKEIWSSYLYLSMAYDMSHKGFAGFAQWFDAQAKEEISHAKKFAEFIEDRNGKVKLLPVDKVKQDWSSVKTAFEDTLAHEKEVTSSIYALYEQATEIKDYATENLLKYFIDEQVEEEKTAKNIVDTLKIIENDTAALYIFNSKLGERK